MKRIIFHCESYIEGMKAPFVQGVQRLRPDIAVTISSSENPATENEIKSCEILITDPFSLPKIHGQYTNLKWVQNIWAGVNPLFYPENQFPSPPSWKLIRNTTGFGRLMAEYVIGHIISWERGFRAQYDGQKNRKWLHQTGQEYYRHLKALSIGILGVGTIGKQVAKSCKDMGMRTAGMVRHKEHMNSDLNTELTELLKSCDYICSILPQTSGTDGLLGGDALKVCKEKKPILINVGRGNLISEPDIVRAIDSERWLSGAILDVFENEPLPPESRLWDHPKVVISPHLAALSLPEDVAEAFVGHLAEYERGGVDALTDYVNWDLKY